MDVWLVMRCAHKKAIDIVIDEEGFEYPLINCEKCVGCGICLKVCPIKS